MKRNLDNFKTPVLKGKENNFLKFLESLGVSSSNIVLDESRGDYQFFSINLRNFTDSCYSSIIEELISNQVLFL